VPHEGRKAVSVCPWRLIQAAHAWRKKKGGRCK
jgi:hypothetical protein